MNKKQTEWFTCSCECQSCKLSRQGREASIETVPPIVRGFQSGALVRSIELVISCFAFLLHGYSEEFEVVELISDAHNFTDDRSSNSVESL